MKKLLLFICVISTIQLAAQEVKPVSGQALLKVLVVDNKNKPQTGLPITFTSQKDKKAYTGTTNAEGRFSLLIPSGQKYQLRYKIFTSLDTDIIELPVNARPYTLEYTITATPPRTFRLDNVFFDSGKSTLRPESDKELNELAEYMSLQKALVIEIAGHTDNVGSPESNQKLSEERANSVKLYLQKKGIAPERVVAKGYGDTQPVADNATAAGKQLNRRTEVRIISE